MLSKNIAVTFLVALSSLLAVAYADLPEYTNSEGKTIWDEAPDFKNDAIQPFPDLKGPNGEDLTIENLRGVHLFGWKGCSGDEGKWIKEAYGDFYKLAQQPELYNNIDWSDQVRSISFRCHVVLCPLFLVSQAHNRNESRQSKTFSVQIATRTRYPMIRERKYNVKWSHSKSHGSTLLTRFPQKSMPQLNRSTTIHGRGSRPGLVGDSFGSRLIFSSVEVASADEYIQVRCSGNDGSGDPEDKCGDRAHQPPQCPPGGNRPPDDDDDQRLEAFSEPNLKYSRITFCSKFFDLPTLTETMDRYKNKPTTDQDNLENWNNRARCFFHEVTHLDYFMNADDSKDDSKSPEVFDAQFQYKALGQTYTAEAYGPFNAKILRNYIPKQKKYIGYYTQRNGQ